MIHVMADTDSRRGGAGPNYAQFIGLGFTFIVAVGVPAAVGYFVDRALGTLPLFLLVGLALGFAGALYHVYRSLKRLGGG